MGDSIDRDNHLRFPPRMFAVGDEPVGLRVTAYHKPRSITQIINALDTEEIQVLRETPFGKLIEIADKPSFSGRFGRYMLSRQLKVRKKYESWFLFAANPVRFSLREFATVTGLNCGQYPPNSKMKSSRNLSAKPYWVELFGTMKEVPTSYVVTMLKKKTISDPQLRIKYALLALLSAVVLPTSHTPRISQHHAEKIKDIDQFLAYPWGRVSFEMLIASIKERDEISLSQKTIALRGFVLSLQLVMIDTVPSLMCVVQDGDLSGEDADAPDDDFIDDDDTKEKKSINPAKVRDIDAAAKAMVLSIIPDGAGDTNANPAYGWLDEVEDIHVDNLVRCVEEGFLFSNNHFTGGATVLDVARLREAATKENISRKTSKSQSRQPRVDDVDPAYIASILRSSVSGDIVRMENEIVNTRETLTASQNLLVTNLQDMFNNFKGEISRLISQSCHQSHPSRCHVSETDTHISRNVTIPGSTPLDACNIIQNAMRFSNNETTNTGNDKPDSVEDTGAPQISMANQAATGDVLDDSGENLGVETEVCTGVDQIHVPNPSPSPAIHIHHNSTLYNVEPVLAFPDPSFSLGLTQEVSQTPKNDFTTDTIPAEEMNDDEPLPPTENHQQVMPNRRSKRQKVVPRSLVGEYQCDSRFLTRAWEAHVNATRTDTNSDHVAKFAALAEKLASDFVIKVGAISLDSRELAAIVHRSTHLPPKVVDVLIRHIRSLFLSYSDQPQPKRSLFMDTKFVALLAKTFPKFSKSTKKESVRFPASVFAKSVGDCSMADADRIYFPFNFDKKHWVGVCVDCSQSQVLVLDCNISLRTDAMIAREMKQISEMFPYILKQAGKDINPKDMKAMKIDRLRSIPQNPSNFDSGMTTILLIHAHSVAGVELCNCISRDVLDEEAERIAVAIYEDHVGVI